MRTANRLSAVLKDQGFAVLGSGAFCGSTCLLVFELETWSLPQVRKVIGPPIQVENRAQEFLKKYRAGRVWVEGRNWTAEVDRTYLEARDLIRATLKGTPKKLQEQGIASIVAKAVSKRVQVLEGTLLLRVPGVPGFIEAYLTEHTPIY